MLKKEVLRPRPGPLKEILGIVAGSFATVGIPGLLLFSAFKLYAFVTPVIAHAPTITLEAGESIPAQPACNQDEHIQWSGQKWLCATSIGNTYDTTAGTITASAFNAEATATRSKGANNLTNIGITATAVGAQTNIALRTVDGANYFNATSGNTSIGYASGEALPTKLNVNGDTYIKGDVYVTGRIIQGSPPAHAR